MRQPRYDQLARIRQMFWQWRQFVPPCGISLIDIYNPCQPEDDPDNPGRLWCVLCGARQRLALEAAK